MEYLIDGLNLIKSSYLKRAERRSLDYAKALLYGFLHRYVRRTPGTSFVVVYDGRSPGRDAPPPGVRVLFSGDDTADETLRILLEERRGRSRAVVVSDDREVQAAGKINGAAVSPVADFLDLVDPPSPAPPAPPREEKRLGARETIAIERELKEFYEQRHQAGQDRRSR